MDSGWPKKQKQNLARPAQSYSFVCPSKADLDMPSPFVIFECSCWSGSEDRESMRCIIGQKIRSERASNFSLRLVNCNQAANSCGSLLTVQSRNFIGRNTARMQKMGYTYLSWVAGYIGRWLEWYAHQALASLGNLSNAASLGRSHKTSRKE